MNRDSFAKSTRILLVPVPVDLPVPVPGHTVKKVHMYGTAKVYRCTCIVGALLPDALLPDTLLPDFTVFAATSTAVSV